MTTLTGRQESTLLALSKLYVECVFNLFCAHCRCFGTIVPLVLVLLSFWGECLTLPYFYLLWTKSQFHSLCALFVTFLPTLYKILDKIDKSHKDTGQCTWNYEFWTFFTQCGHFIWMRQNLRTIVLIKELKLTELFSPICKQTN